MKKMLSFAAAALFAMVGSAEEIESSTITSDIENDYGQNPYGTVCQMSSFLEKTATLKWCSLGTSITWYNDAPRPELGLTHGYQDRTIEKLGLNKTANFINRGVSGARIGDAYTEPPAGSPCDIYTLEWGINDWMRGTRVGNMEIFRRRLANPDDKCEDITTEVWYTFASQYALLIRQIKAVNPNAIIILMTPRKAFNNNNNLNNSMREHWWDQSRPDSGQQEATYLYDYVKLIRAIGEEIHCPVVDQFRYAANVENLESLSIDKALHPNDAGYEVMANLLAPVMSQAIEAKYGITRCTHAGTTSVVPGTAATCTESGTTEKTVCTNPDCQMVLVPSETIPALGHNWGEWAETTPATESATGLKRRDCSRCDEYEELVVPRVGEIIALRNIAVVTKVGEPPVLPAYVAGLRADGTIAGQCDVVWDDHGAPSAVGRTTITGTAMVDGMPKSVTASVRATVEHSDDDIENIALNNPPTTAYPMSGITYGSNPKAAELANQVNGYYENNSLVWYGAQGAAKDGDYNGKFAKEVFVFEFAFAIPSTVKSFSVWHMTDSGWLENPYPAFAEVSTDNGTTWTPVAVTGGAKPNSSTVVPTSTGTAYVFKYGYELASPVASVTKLRLKFSPYGIETPEPGDSSTWKGLKISEIEVFGVKGESDGPLEPLTSDTLSALSVDGAAVPGFSPTTLSYSVEEARVITSATSVDNVGVTILPRVNGAAHVVTLSESGSTKTYTVEMPVACEHEHQTITPAVDATCTTAGSTRSVYCEDCKRYLESSTEIPALGHAWDKGEDTTPPTCTAKGVRTYTCTRTGCGETRTEDIEARGHNWGEWVVTKAATKTEAGSQKRECRRQGCAEEETQVIPMLADVVMLRNVAVVTAVGVKPTLPAKVAGLKADGTVDGEFDVVWDSAAAPVAAGITTVNGSATVHNEEMSVTASVRAVIPHTGETTNVALGVHPTAYAESGIAYPKMSDQYALNLLTTGLYENDAFPLYARNTQGTEGEFAGKYAKDIFVFQFALAEPATVSGFCVWHMTDSNWLLNPYPAFAEVSTDGGNTWTEVAVTGGARPPSSTVVQKAGGDTVYVFKYEYSLNTPAAAVTNVRFKMSPYGIKVPVPTDVQEESLGFKIAEIEVLSPVGGDITPTSTDTLTALEVDGSAVAGFVAGTTSYSVEGGQAITKAENDTDNVAVTILQKSVTATDNAYAVTLAEDGESTKRYTVSLPPMHAHIFGPWQVITPATVYASGLRRRVCTVAGCTVKEEQVIPQIERRSVKWIDVDFANYADGSVIADAQVDTVDRGTWAKPDADDTATVAHGDPALAALAITNRYLCYAAKAQTSAGRDATVEFKAKFQKPNADTLPPALDLGQTAVFVFPKGKTSCYKAYTADGWVELTGATPDFTKFVTITIDVRYEYGERLAMVKIDGAVCRPVGAETPWFALAGSATKLSSVKFFGEFDLGPFWGEYLTEAVRNGFLIIVK